MASIIQPPFEDPIEFPYLAEPWALNSPSRGHFSGLAEGFPDQTCSRSVLDHLEQGYLEKNHIPIKGHVGTFPYRDHHLG